MVNKVIRCLEMLVLSTYLNEINVTSSLEICRYFLFFLSTTVCKLPHLLGWHIALIVLDVACLGLSAVVVVTGVLLPTTSVVCKWKSELRRL